MIEKAKNLLIFLLVLLLIALLFFSFALISVSEPLSPADLFYEIGSRLHNSAATSSAGSEELTAAAFPCRIAVTVDGKVYSPVTVAQFEDAYFSLSQFIDEAVGSADGARPVSESFYLDALAREGILFTYDYPIPFYMLYAWADNGYTDFAESVASLLVFKDGNAVSLLVKTTGGCFCFDTKSTAEQLLSLTAPYQPNGSYAFSLGFDGCSPDCPMTEGSSALSYSLLPSPYVEDGELPRDILDIFSINSYLASVYRDLDSLVYVENGNLLRLYDDGRIVYSIAQQASGIPLGLHETDLPNETRLEKLNRIYSLVASLWQKTSSADARISFSSVLTQDGEETYLFDAYIGGSFVERDRPACAVRITGDSVTDIVLYPLRLSAGESVGFVPFRQAAASLSGGVSVLRVHYVLSESGVLTPVMRSLKGE